MTDSLLQHCWLAQLADANTIWVAFSGGLDSTVLLHSLVSQPYLQGKLHAVHIHHGLSQNAARWQQHCEEVCSGLDIPIQVHQINFDRTTNVEESARKARYSVFSSLLKENDVLVLGHHADDQAETLLLQLFRGAGVDGLAGMPTLKPLGNGIMLRPLLSSTRDDLEVYAKFHQLRWIEDESNFDTAYSRNFLRQQILPLLEQKWPGVSRNLSRTADHMQTALANLQDLGQLDGIELDNNKLAIAPLQYLSRSRIVNVIRVWLKNNKVQFPSTALFNRLVDEVIPAKIDAVPLIEWGRVKIKRYQQFLYLIHKDVTPVSICEESLLNQLKQQGLQVPINGKISIRTRQGGEVVRWRGQTKQLKKLLQEWQIPPWEREQLLLLYINDQLAAVPGYAISEDFQ